jgi:hypothetical protein
MVSGVKVPRDKIERGHWSYGYQTIYPESVLVADTSKQNYSIYPREYYVDLLEYCRTCNRPFIFFAREQKHWFETLRFFVDARCVLCPECRRDSQTHRRRLRRYSDLFAKPTKSARDLMHLVNDGAYLLRRGVLRNLSTLGRLKNEAARRIPDYQGTLQLAEVIKRARAFEKG